MSDRISEPQPLSYARRRECPDGGTSNRAGRQVGNSGFHGVGGEGGAKPPHPYNEGVLEDHSGGYRIEALRPDGCLIGLRHGEVRPVLIQSPLGSGHDHLWQIRTP